MLKKLVKVGKALLILQQAIKKEYPVGTEVRVKSVTLEVTEPEKDPREIVLKRIK